MSWEPPLRAVVAIPARNEEQRLRSCLDALAQQRDRSGRRLPAGQFGVVLLLNNCDDGSAEVARLVARSFPAPLQILDRCLAPHTSNAGGARRAAMDAAAAWLEGVAQGGLLLTTDADSRVGATWITDNLAAADAGADAVAGLTVLDAADERSLPEPLRERSRLEKRYEWRLGEIAALLDPRPHNPWPHHGTMSGASLAVTVDAYRRIGGLPALPLGEDKGLVAALEAHDARVRFAPDIRVVTSGRLVGRAAGGAADTIRLRCEDPHAPCDETLEPADVAAFRARWRGWLRRLHAQGEFDGATWAPLLGAEVRPCDAPHFGMAWNHIQLSSPMLRRRSLSPRDLPSQIKLADSILRRLRNASPARHHVQPKPLSAMLIRHVDKTTYLAKEDLRGFVS